MNGGHSSYTTRFVHKASAVNADTTALVISGVLSFVFIHWILGLVIVIVGATALGNRRKVSICGACGNEVANTSRMCPHCHCGFDRVEIEKGSQAVLYATLGSLALTGLVGLALWWMLRLAAEH